MSNMFFWDKKFSNTFLNLWSFLKSFGKISIFRFVRLLLRFRHQCLGTRHVSNKTSGIRVSMKKKTFRRNENSNSLCFVRVMQQKKNKSRSPPEWFGVLEKKRKKQHNTFPAVFRRQNWHRCVSSQMKDVNF